MVGAVSGTAVVTIDIGAVRLGVAVDIGGISVDSI